MYDVVIIGAGPAGLFTAYELITNDPKLKIALIEEGKDTNSRICPMNKLGKPCQNCNPCNILAGYGGAGTFSDNKLNFIPKLGKSDLLKYMNESDSNKLIEDTEQIFTKFGMDAEVYPSNLEEALKIKKQITLTGARLLLIKQKHLGSDKLPGYIKNFCDYLEGNNITLKLNCKCIDIKTTDDGNNDVILKNGEILKTKNVVVAPGRTGAKWVQELADKYSIPYL